jgi:nucleoside-diphosphate-sugar epimerase
MSEESRRRPTALITGASGYIGGKLTMRLISCGWSVHTVVRPSSRINEATASSASRLVYDGTLGSLLGPVAQIGPDVAFHIASDFQQDQSVETSDRLVLSNIVFPLHLVEAMLASGCTKLVNTSTFWQHYEGREYLPVDLYAATKQAAEDLLLYYHDARQLSCVTLTLFDTYGPRDPRRKLINIITDAMANGAQLDLSPGDQIIDLTHVEDVVDAFCAAAKAMENRQDPVWEKAFVSGERVTVKTLVELIAASSSAPLNVKFGARPYKPREIMVPIQPAASPILGAWTPRRKLEEELRALVSEPIERRTSAG